MYTNTSDTSTLQYNKTNISILTVLSSRLANKDSNISMPALNTYLVAFC